MSTSVCQRKRIGQHILDFAVGFDGRMSPRQTDGAIRRAFSPVPEAYSTVPEMRRTFSTVKCRAFRDAADVFNRKMSGVFEMRRDVFGRNTADVFDRKMSDVFDRRRVHSTAAIRRAHSAVVIRRAYCSTRIHNVPRDPSDSPVWFAFSHSTKSTCRTRRLRSPHNFASDSPAPGEGSHR